MSNSIRRVYLKPTPKPVRIKLWKVIVACALCSWSGYHIHPATRDVVQIHTVPVPVCEALPSKTLHSKDFKKLQGAMPLSALHDGRYHQ